MAFYVVSGATMMCSFGSAPAVLNVIRPTITITGFPVATIMDFIPIGNIPPFGSCSAPTNPAVIAASGSPVPCVPVIPAPWAPGNPTVTIQNQPALMNDGKCLCSWAGNVSITYAGQTLVQG